MSIKIKHLETEFGIGDVIRVHQKIVEEGKKTRTQVFEGMVIAIKNRDEGKSFTVRRIGVAKVGIEIILPLNSPNIEKIEVVRQGMKGTHHAKLYFLRDKSKREIERMFSRASKKTHKK